MQKIDEKYDKLNLDQFKYIVGELPEIRNQMKESPNLLNSDHKEKIKGIMERGIYWAFVYELSFQELIALLICALECQEELHKAAQSDDPTQAAFGISQ